MTFCGERQEAVTTRHCKAVKYMYLPIDGACVVGYEWAAKNVKIGIRTPEKYVAISGAILFSN